MQRRTVETRMIRTPVTGPEPCNTLVFLRCLVPGVDVTQNNGDLVRGTVPLQTTFRLDGYLQSQYRWHRDNTLVSASCSLKLLNTITDLSFLFAVDRVAPVLSEADGGLGFDVDLASWAEDDALFASGEKMAMTVSLTAYVLCWEPRAERPTSGSQRTLWAERVANVPRWSPRRVLGGGG